jgi:hypothetical protein
MVFISHKKIVQVLYELSSKILLRDAKIDFGKCKNMLLGSETPFTATYAPLIFYDSL